MRKEWLVTSWSSDSEEYDTPVADPEMRCFRTKPEAIKAAKRLAGENPGTEFGVLKLIGIAETSGQVTFKAIS